MKKLLIVLVCISAPLREAFSETYELVIVAGQSNAVGFDAKPDKLPQDPVDAKVLFWWKTGDPPPDKHDSHSSNAWTTLRAQPLGNPAPKNNAARQYGNFAQVQGGFGPEIGFARELLRQEPERKLAILKVAFSGTSIPRDWDPEKKDLPGSCYQAFLTELKKAQAAARQRDIKLKPTTLIWVQGESDATPQNAPRYAADLSNLISAMRKDTGSTHLTALLAVNTRFGNGKIPHMPDIVKAQKKVAEADPHIAYVDTAKAPIANGAHYNTEGTLLVGKWFAQKLLSRVP